MQNIRSFDTYRGLAAIVVFTSHLCATFLFPYTGSAGLLATVSTLMATWAVNIFFILSGYLITCSILINVRDNGRFVWQDYLVSRVARIYPPLIAAILLSTLLYWVVVIFDLHGKDSFRLSSDLYVIRDRFVLEFREILSCVLMKGGLLSINGPLWSLYVEVKIYLIAMFTAIMLVGKVGIRGMLLAVAALVMVALKLSQSVLYVVIWSWGAIYAVIQFGKWDIYRRDLRLLRGMVLIVSLFYVLYKRDIDLFMQDNETMSGVLAKTALSFLLAGLICRGRTPGWVSSVFASTAKYSYTLYIVHFPLLLFSFSLTHRYLSADISYRRLLAVGAPVVVFVVGTAYLLSRFFENKKRFERLMRRLIAVLPVLKNAPETTGGSPQR